MINYITVINETIKHTTSMKTGISGAIERSTQCGLSIVSYIPEGSFQLTVQD